MNLENIRAVVFDFDGVVVNSEPFYEKAITDVFKENSIIIPQKDWADFKGMADKEFFPLMISRYGFKGNINKLESDIYDRMKQKLVELDYIIHLDLLHQLVANTLDGWMKIQKLKTSSQSKSLPLMWKTQNHILNLTLKWQHYSTLLRKISL